MNQELEGFEPSRLFFDDDNFPHGFNKSGDFTIRESQLLSTYGTVMRELYAGSLQAGNTIQQRFVDVCRGLCTAESPLEKVWLKYLDKSHRKNTVPRSRFAANDSLATGFIDDVDLELDV